MVDDVVVKKETKYKVERESDLERDAKSLGDKAKAAAKAGFNKVDEGYRDLKMEYEKEKLKEKLD